MDESDIADMKLIELLVIIAALLGIITTISPLKLTWGGLNLTTLYIFFLITFMFYSAVAYAGILGGKPNNRTYINAVIFYFSLLLAYPLLGNLAYSLYQSQTPTNTDVSIAFVLAFVLIAFLMSRAIHWRYR